MGLMDKFRVERLLKDLRAIKTYVEQRSTKPDEVVAASVEHLVYETEGLKQVCSQNPQLASFEQEVCQLYSFAVEYQRRINGAHPR